MITTFSTRIGQKLVWNDSESRARVREKFSEHYLYIMWTKFMQHTFHNVNSTEYSKHYDHWSGFPYGTFILCTHEELLVNVFVIKYLVLSLSSYTLPRKTRLSFTFSLEHYTWHLTSNIIENPQPHSPCSRPLINAPWPLPTSTIAGDS